MTIWAKRETPKAQTEKLGCVATTTFRPRDADLAKTRSKQTNEQDQSKLHTVLGDDTVGIGDITNQRAPLLCILNA